MNIVTSFAPIANPSAQVLILGSMPGIASLTANQYYAHPRNSFWRIMADIYGFNFDGDYSTRVAHLLESGVAVWDVLSSCERAGSLDSAIVNGSRVVNDFPSFFKQHFQIKLILFNGTEAEKSFNKNVLNQLDLKHLSFMRLPSSSPTHTLALPLKIAAWKKALSPYKLT